MDPWEDDEGDASDWAATSAALTRAPEPAADDFQRHLRAEAQWQGWLVARRLWDRVSRCIALGR